MTAKNGLRDGEDALPGQPEGKALGATVALNRLGADAQERSHGLRFLDLFSGIGGFALGLERAGHHTAAFCEISPKCRHLLSHHWPDVPIYDDVQTLTAERLAADGVAVDAICGGFPCQDISCAGNRVGIEGERSGLWREYARLIRELRPRIVVVENVAALLNRGLGVVLADLAELGYDAVWDCIRASDVGAPHLRARLWIVAYPRGEQHEGYGHAIRRALAEELLGAAADAGRPVANTDDGQRDGQVIPLRAGRPAAGLRRQDVANAGCLGREAMVEPDARRADSEGSEHPTADAGLTGWWAGWTAEPDVGRGAHGVPARVDRLHGLGNAVVPEIPYRLGRAILTARAAA